METALAGDADFNEAPALPPPSTGNGEIFSTEDPASRFSGDVLDEGMSLRREEGVGVESLSHTVVTRRSRPRNWNA